MLCLSILPSFRIKDKIGKRELPVCWGNIWPFPHLSWTNLWDSPMQLNIRNLVLLTCVILHYQNAYVFIWDCEDLVNLIVPNEYYFHCTFFSLKKNPKK